MHINLKFSGRQMALIYGGLILLTTLFFGSLEYMTGRSFDFNAGGRDMIFSFYDVSLFVVLAVSIALTLISTMAYIRKKNERLFFVAFAFFMFSIKSALKILDNNIIGPYVYLGISIQTLELLILLSLFFAIFKK